MLYSFEARAAVMVVMFTGIATGASVGGTLAAVIQVQESPVVSGVCLGAGVCGDTGLRLGVHIGQKVGGGIGY